jgi:hypothetical protein
MCLPACAIQLAEMASRRSFLRNLGVAAAGAAIAPAASRAEEPPRFSFQRLVDLTHTLHPHFPFPMEKAFSMERIGTRPKEMWNIYRWHFNEHIGTHIDAVIVGSPKIAGGSGGPSRVLALVNNA